MPMAKRILEEHEAEHRTGSHQQAIFFLEKQYRRCFVRRQGEERKEGVYIDELEGQTNM
jgi:hypothetical protein